MKNYYTMKRVLTLTIALLVTGGANAESAVIMRDTNLLWTPSFSSGSAGQLHIGAEVDAGEHKGGWRKITTKSDGKSGWVRRYTMRSGLKSNNINKATQTTQTDSLKNGLSSIGRLFASLFYSGDRAKPQNRGNLTVTAGIRGLNAQDIEQAQPDTEMLNRMLAFHEHPESANSFASAANLRSQHVNYLPKPQIERHNYKDK
jgi:hypothetical protein